MIKYSCVIPTLGRITLRRSVLSVQNQHREIEIIVVVDKEADSIDVEKKLIGLDVKILKSSSSGAANLRNLGVQSSSGNWILFLDDDDMWLPSRILNLEYQMALNPDIRMFTSRSLQISGTRILVRPKNSWNLEGSILKNWYKPHFGKSRMYMATGTWAIQAENAKSMNFDANLIIREDLKYLFSFNEKIFQSNSIDCIIHHSKKRSTVRESFQSGISWVKFLKEYSILTALNFLVFEYLRTEIIKVLIGFRGNEKK